MLTLAALIAAAGAYDQIVVIDMRAKDVEQNLADNLTEVVLSTVRNHAPDASVVSQSELQAMLEVEQTKQLLGCTDDIACWAEIGGALGAGHLITASLGKIGNVFLVNIKLINTTTGSVDGHASERISGDEERLITTVISMTRGLILGEDNALAAPSLETSVETSPWYATWWFWTIVGAVVAGGITAAILASTAESDTGGVVAFEFSPNGLRLAR